MYLWERRLKFELPFQTTQSTDKISKIFCSIIEVVKKYFMYKMLNITKFRYYKLNFRRNSNYKQKIKLNTVYITEVIGILFKLDRICASLDTADLFMLLHRATLESVDSVQKAFAYPQISNVQRAITKVVQKKICCNSLFIFNLPPQVRILLDNNLNYKRFLEKLHWK